VKELESKTKEQAATIKALSARLAELEPEDEDSNT
jgi:uncharacterized coiled-coil protein SlyX